jgi:hypothetical protein
MVRTRAHRYAGKSTFLFAAFVMSVAGCSGADKNEGDKDKDDDNGTEEGPPSSGKPSDPEVPTGPPSDMAWPKDAGVTPSRDAGGRRPAADASGPVKPGNTDAGAPVSDPPEPGNDGPLNMAPAAFEPNVKVSDDPGRGQQTEVVMAAHPKGLLFAGWMDNRQSPSRCAYSVSKDRGKSWSKNVFAATQGTGRAFAGDPAVAIDDAGNLYAGCQDYASGGLGTNYVLLAHSKDEGATWSEFKRVNQSLDKPWLGATADGTVLLTWLGNPGGVKRSTDFGATWSTPISLGYINHGTTMSIGSKGLVHMAYNTAETTVTYRRSSDFGVTFESARNLSPQGTPCRSPCSPRSHPIVGADTDPTGQVVAITWASRQTHADAEGDDDVWVIVSYDAGKTFSAPIRVNDNMNPSRQFQSWAAVDAYGAVHVVWTDLRNGGNNDTYYARMTELAKGFEPNVKVNDGTGKPASFLGDYKGIDIIGRDVVITWTDNRSDVGDIYFARAPDAAAAGGPLMP